MYKTIEIIQADQKPEKMSFKATENSLKVQEPTCMVFFLFFKVPPFPSFFRLNWEDNQIISF